MPYTLRISAGSEPQKTYPLLSQTGAETVDRALAKIRETIPAKAGEAYPLTAAPMNSPKGITGSPGSK